MRSYIGGPARFVLAGLIFGSLMLPGPAAAHDGGRDGIHEASSGISRIDEFAGWFHDAGNLLLHVSNRGRFGRTGADVTNPSAEWPAGSNHEYLYGAGLWVGGVVTRGGVPDTMVSAGLYQFGEFYNRTTDEGCGSPPEGICTTFEGAPSGLRRFDDDGDVAIDEDPLDGADNDGDGRIDEDFAGISQQMFRTVYYDTSIFFNQFFSDPANQHTPMGLRVVQESYVWTDPQFDDFVGIEFRVTNISDLIDPIGWPITSAYIGFMVDGDVGIDDDELNYWDDDQGAYGETTVVFNPPVLEDSSNVYSLTMGYVFDETGDQNSADDVPGFAGVMFLGHTTDDDPDDDIITAPAEVGIHAFRIWSSGEQDPRDDLDRYRFLRGDRDDAQTIDPPTVRANDYRCLVSAGPFATIEPGSTLTFQVAFVCGNMIEIPDPDSPDGTRRAPDWTNPIQAQRVYDGFLDDDTGDIINWATSSPPPPPNITVTPGDNHVVVEWDHFPENVPDPLTKVLDFAGYQVWKAEGWRRQSNIPADDMWRLIADFDSTELADIDAGLTGIGKYRYVDNRVQNGFWYWYAVTAYDKGTFTTEIDTTASPPETTLVRTEDPKYGKFTQNMVRVMPCPTSTQTLDDVYVVPNPYKGSAAWDLAETSFEPTGRRIKFFNLPERATIRIFTLAGDHVITIEHDDCCREDDNPVGCTSWNLISKNNQDTVSGIYLYHVTSGIDGSETIGKFVIIR